MCGRPKAYWAGIIKDTIPKEYKVQGQERSGWDTAGRVGVPCCSIMFRSREVVDLSDAMVLQMQPTNPALFQRLPFDCFSNKSLGISEDESEVRIDQNGTHLTSSFRQHLNRITVPGFWPLSHVLHALSSSD